MAMQLNFSISGEEAFVDKRKHYYLNASYVQ